MAVVLWINAMVPVAKAELSLQDKDDIARVEYYLNSVKTLSADFIQISPDSSISRGRFYLKRPGRLRFEYDPPSKHGCPKPRDLFLRVGTKFPIAEVVR